jgi:hypothetical protein
MQLEKSWEWRVLLSTTPVWYALGPECHHQLTSHSADLATAGLAASCNNLARFGEHGTLGTQDHGLSMVAAGIILECAFSWAYERRSLDARNAAVSRRHKYPQNAHPASISCILYPSRLFSNPPPFPELSFSAFPSFEISSGIFILTN